MLDALKDWFLDWFYGLLYQLQAGVCNLIDFIKKIFFKLCGLDTVTIDGESNDLVSSLISSDTIHSISHHFFDWRDFACYFRHDCIDPCELYAERKEGQERYTVKSGAKFSHHAAGTVFIVGGDVACEYNYGFDQHGDATTYCRRTNASSWRTNADNDGKYGHTRTHRRAGNHRKNVFNGRGWII